MSSLCLSSDFVPDIEETQRCSQDHCKGVCPGCPKHNQSFAIEFQDSKWIKVETLSDLLSVLRTPNIKNYMLVAGNTAKGKEKPMLVIKKEYF